VTTDVREPQPRDLNLSASGRIIAWQESKTHQALDLWPSLTVLLPTSEISRKTGTYFVTSPRFVLTYVAPFLPGVDFPNTIILGAAIRWDHRFTEATEPVSAEVAARISRPTATYDIRPSSNLDGTPWAHDTVTAQGAVYFAGSALGQPIFLSIGSALSRQYLYRFEEIECLQVNAGVCLDVMSNDDLLPGGAAAYRDVIQFDVLLEYWMLPEVAWSVGYLNNTSRLGPDGLSRSPFYSPGALFTTQLIVSLDAIYEGLTGPRRHTAWILPG
jgi:hypothetical protein